MAEGRIRYNPDGSTDMRADDGTFVRISTPGTEPGSGIYLDASNAPEVGAQRPAPARDLRELNRDHISPRNKGRTNSGPAAEPDASALGSLVSLDDGEASGPQYLDAENAPGGKAQPLVLTEHAKGGTQFVSEPKTARAVDLKRIPARADKAAPNIDEWLNPGVKGPAQQQLDAAPRMMSVTNTQSSTTRQRDTPGLRRALQEVTDFEAGVAGIEQERADNEIQRFALERDNAEKKQQIEEAYLARQQKRNADRAQYIKGMQSKREAAEQQFMNSEVDPDKYWTDKGTPAKILGGIGIMISGMGQSMQAAGGQENTSNMALDMIDKAIERDIDAQKANIKKAGDSIGFLDGALANYSQAFGDESLAEHAAYLTSYKIAEQELTRAMSGVKSKDTLLAADQAIQLLQQRQAERKMALEEAFAGKETIERQTKQVPVPQVDPLSLREDGGLPGLIIEDRAAFEAMRQDPAAFRDWRKQVAAMRAVGQSLKTLEDIRTQYGAEAWNAEAIEKYNTARNGLMSLISVARGQGALQREEFKHADKSIPNIEPGMSDLLPGDRNLGRIKGLSAALGSELNAAVSTVGARLAGTEDTNLATSAEGETAQRGLQGWD